ncbi:MAG: DUF2061 domain-containing protein [Pyrinomonadaceae bacterium]
MKSNASVNETRGRALTKAVSYRLLSSLLTGALFFGAIQRARLALTLALVDSAIKILVFYLHERAWTRISGSQNYVEGVAEVVQAQSALIEA